VRGKHRGAAVARAVVRVAFWTEAGLGVTFWTGHAGDLAPLHVAVGLALAGGLEALAVLAASAPGGSWLVFLAVCWGILTPAFGLLHDHLLTSGGHWLVQVAHLLAGVAAVVLAEALAARLLAPSGAHRPFGR
jgi:hypothetical protein